MIGTRQQYVRYTQHKCRKSGTTRTNAVVSNESRLPSQLKTSGCSARGGWGCGHKKGVRTRRRAMQPLRVYGRMHGVRKRCNGDGGPTSRRHRTPRTNARAIIQSSPKLVNFEIRANALHPLFFYFIFFFYVCARLHKYIMSRDDANRRARGARKPNTKSAAISATTTRGVILLP